MSDFSKTYDSTIHSLETTLSNLIDSGSDFDFEREGDVLKIEFEDGEKFIISPNSPVSQLWVSANFAGHRFNWDAAQQAWLNEKTSEELLQFLAASISGKLGEAVTLS